MTSSQKIFGVISTFLLSCAASGTAWAATYYVATTGNDSNAGTEAAPFKNVQKAVGIVRAGDTVIIKAGRHRAFELRNKHGAAGMPITFKGEPGAIVDRNLGGGNGGFRPIEVFGGSYITIDGLELTDSDTPPGYADCATKGGTGRGGRQGIKLNKGSEHVYPHHLIFSNLHIHHVASQGILGSADDSQFLSNHVHDNGSRLANEQAYGTYLKGKRWLIRGNRIHGNTGNGIRTGNDSRQGLTELLVDSIIENNIVYNNGGNFMHTNGNTGECRIVNGGDGIVVWHGSGNIIRNNIVYRNAGHGIRINEDFGANKKHNLVYNNTVYRNKKPGLVTYYPHDKSIIKNNISYMNSGKDISSIGGVLSNNLTTDPKFVNAEAGDFGLEAGSPAIDAGMTLKTEVPNDFTGKKRPEGAAYDIGAFEGAGSRADVLPGMGGGLPPGAGGGAAGGGGSDPLGLGHCFQY